MLRNNYFEFNGEVNHQIFGNANAAKFAPPYACIFMDHVESEFWKIKQDQPLVWFRYIDDIFFIWSHRQDKLVGYLDNFNKFHPNECSKKILHF